MRQTGNLVCLFFESHAFFQVLELKVSSDFRKDGEGERVPGRQQLILCDQISVFNQNVRAVNDLIARDFTAAFIDDR